jgi:hypothetical protein
MKKRIMIVHLITAGVKPTIWVGGGDPALTNQTSTTPTAAPGGCFSPEKNDGGRG